MSLPWFQMDTAQVLIDRDMRIQANRKASDTEGAAEIGALLASGRLPLMTMAGLASTLGWTRKKVKRLLRDWHIEAADQPWGRFGAARGQARGSEGAAVPEESPAPTDSEGQARGRQGAEEGHRARVLLIEEEEEREVDWTHNAWEELCTALGKNPNRSKLTPARKRMLRKCADVAADFSEPGQTKSEALICYLQQIPTSGNRWMVERAPSVETPIKPQKIRSYLEAWDESRGTGAPEAAALDYAAIAADQLTRAIRLHGRSDPPRRRDNAGSFQSCWRFEAPTGIDAGKWDEALFVALRGIGGWGGLFRGQKDQPFAIRQVARSVGERFGRRS